MSDNPYQSPRERGAAISGPPLSCFLEAACGIALLLFAANVEYELGPLTFIRVISMPISGYLICCAVKDAYKAGYNQRKDSP